MGSQIYEKQDYQEALDKFILALHYDDQNPDIYYNLGKTNHAVKNYTAAIAHYERALQLDPKTVRLTCIMGMYTMKLVIQIQL